MSDTGPENITLRRRTAALMADLDCVLRELELVPCYRGRVCNPDHSRVRTEKQPGIVILRAPEDCLVNESDGCFGRGRNQATQSGLFCHTRGIDPVDVEMTIIAIADRAQRRVLKRALQMRLGLT